MTALLNWLNTTLWPSWTSISIMAWLGLLASVGITTLAVGAVAFLFLVDFRIGKPKVPRVSGES